MRTRHRLIAFCLLLLALGGLFYVPPAAVAGGENTPLNLNLGSEVELERTTSLGFLLIRYIFSIALILFLIYFGVGFLVRRFQPALFSGNWIQVLDKVVIDKNKGLLLVEIESKGYVLGVSEYGLSLITTIEDEERMDELRSLSLRNPSSGKPGSLLFRRKKRDSFEHSLEGIMRELKRRDKNK